MKENENIKQKMTEKYVTEALERLHVYKPFGELWLNHSATLKETMFSKKSEKITIEKPARKMYA